ncbi:MAG: hypothetical protein LHW56_01850 [Candidatus Cloacimonetes bacterium]|nr:hypothetical protein [Candidatus Cloacimonadota bacterium]MDY0171631.1 hypothetical protein [Candidatus Cloacimonadaceae bacterium]
MQKVRLFYVENGQVTILGAVTRFPAESEARKQAQALVASSRKREECHGVLA